MHEIIINLHMHTTYSDGYGAHQDIASAALKAGLDAVIVTDHNVLVNGPEDYHEKDGRRVLLLIGEEVHDQARVPQKNHLLVLGADRELATLASEPQRLIDAVRQAHGLSFIAHPFDPESKAIKEKDITWVDWKVTGYTGIELWNGFSEFKGLLKSKLHAIYYAFQPMLVAHGPDPRALQKWDELLAAGNRVTVVGGSDAHAIPVRLGPLKRTVFPYEYHFRSVNTHLLLPSLLKGDLAEDRRAIYSALSGGRAFVGYDLPAATRGFRFTAKGRDQMVWMGQEISCHQGVTLQIRLPQAVECRLIRNGVVVKSWHKQETCVHITSEPGAYRVEAYIEFRRKRRGWIFSNPIYVTR